MLFWIAQILGVFTFAFYIPSFQMKTKENLLIMQVVSNTFATAQYMLLAAFAGAAQNLLGVLRGAAFYLYKKRGFDPNIALFIVFEAAIVFGAVLTWDNILSLLPLIGMSANLYGQWQNNMKIIRILAVVSAVLWSVYAFYTGVYTAMITELFKMGSSIIGLWRFKKINPDKN